MLTTLLSTAAITAASLAPDSVANDTTNHYRDLQDVVVVAQKSIITSDGAKISYNLDEDASTKGASLIDALRKVPLITVDGEDKIQIKGKSGFKIYVNGKPEPMLEANYSTIFRAMPAEAVAKIEVITEPGAKYDAEGVTGILNLITIREQKLNGYAGSLQARIGNQMGAGAQLSTKHDKLSFDLNGNYANGTVFPRGGYEISYITAPTSSMLQTREQKIGFNFGNMSLNGSWEASPKDLITFGGNATLLHADMSKMSASNTTFNHLGDVISKVSQKFNGFLKNNTASANCSYQHSFNDKGETLSLLYLFNYGYNPIHLNSENAYTGEVSSNMPLYEGNLTNTYDREHTVQLDYTKPFNDAHTFETGLKMILRNNSNFAFTAFGNTPELLTEALSTPNDNDIKMNQLQNVYAAYGSYTGQFGKISTTAGVRYEHCDMSIQDLTGKNSQHWTRLNDVVPNAAMTYILTPTENVRLAYHMRISRPTISQVTPYAISAVNGYLQKGNPDLTSSRVNNFSLTYSNYSGALNGNIGIDYTFNNNGIMSFLKYDKGTIIQTYENIGRSQHATLNGTLIYKMGAKLQTSFNGSVSYYDFKYGQLANDGFSGSYTINATYLMPLGIRLTAFGGQSFPEPSLQGSESGWYYYGMGLSRNFLKSKRLQVALNANNFLKRYHSFNTDYTIGEQRFSRTYNNEAWSVSCSVAWRFGDLKTSTKKATKSILNDDRSSASAQGGIGSTGR